MPDEDLDSATLSGRTFWSGTITFALVSVPVALLPASRSNRTSLRMVSPEGSPLSRRYFASRDERPLEWEDIVRGYEIDKDKYVVLDDEELKRIAPERTRDIDLRLFVKTSEIDPMYFERAYFLTPAGESTKAYRLLAKVMEESDRAGIATFVMRGKEYLVAILAENGVLRAETLRFAAEVRSPQVVGLPDPVDVKPADVKRVEKEITKLAKSSLNTTELGDSSEERLLKLVDKKVRSGKDVVHYDETEGEDRSDVLDLVALLQRSLKTGGNGATGDPSKGNGAGKLKESSKADLYERAKKLDIPGRSEMTKDELIAAIRRTA